MGAAFEHICTQPAQHPERDDLAPLNTPYAVESAELPMTLAPTTLSGRQREAPRYLREALRGAFDRRQIVQGHEGLVEHPQITFAFIDCRWLAVDIEKRINGCLGRAN